MNRRWLPLLAVASFVLTCGLHAAAQTAPAEERVTRSADGPASDHAADELRDPSTFETVRRAPNEVSIKPRVSGSNKGFASPQAVYGDSYIYDATVDVFSDRDDDGYYRYLRVRFDADTTHTFRYVYAEIYLSADGTAWEHLYTTKDFIIWGQDPDDDYEVETELVSGYSTGLYDVLIELYDADDLDLVDEFGPNESSDFSLVPLEDSGRDGALIVLPPETHTHEGGGGAFSWLGVAALAGALGLRRRRTHQA
jgi:hypothetical protein